MKNWQAHLPSPGQLGFGALGALSILLLLLFAEQAVPAAGQGLLLCYKTVIPALFPFMVCSELLISCGGAELLGRALSGPMQAVLGVPGAAACPVLLGALCGFPVGARATAALYDQGQLSARQCTRLLTFVNNPSSAYLISAVGVSLFGSRRLGILLLVTSLALSFVTALLTRPMFKGDVDTKPPLLPKSVHVNADVFVNSVTAAAANMLSVCALVVFFSATVGALQGLISGLPQPGVALLRGLLELSGGMAEAAKIPDVATSASLCALFSGWSGLSVLCQVAAVCRGRGIRLLPYVLAKLLQGLVGAAVVYLAVKHLFPLLPPENVHAVLLVPGDAALWLAGVLNVAFLTACATLVRRICKSMHRPRTADIY